MATSFRLMSVNLLHEWCDVPSFVRVVDDLSPDVVVTQELGPEAAAVLAESYPNHHLRPARDYTGRGIATTFDAEFDDMPMPARQGTSARISLDGLMIRLAGVHLRNPVDFPWWVTAGERRRQLDTLMRWVDSTADPVVVAGDFNATPAWPAYRHVAESLTDLIAEHASSKGERARPTWGWRPGWPRMLRIDHVFGRGVRAVDNLLVPIKGSDHSAIVADILIDAAVT